MKIERILVACALVVIGVFAGLASSSAQTTTPISPRGAAIASGPSGMWIVVGNRIYICQVGVQQGIRPPSAVCGAPLALP